MNALIKKSIFLLRWILLTYCYWFSASASAMGEVHSPQTHTTADKSIIQAKAQIAKKSVAAADNESNPPVSVLVVVDTLIADYQTLVKDIQDHNADQNINIVYLDQDHNGVQQITDALANHTGVAAIHLLTHGMAGSIQLGNAALNQNTIDLYTGQLAAWRNSLSADADILIYGCSITSTEAGLALIRQIGELTQADIAAGKNLRGAASFGADWNLDSHYGKIETNVIISAQTQQTWDSILAYSNYINIGPGGVDQAFKDTSNVGTSFSYDSPGATYSVNRVAIQLKILSGADTSQNITLCLRSSWNGANITAASMATTELTTSYAWYAFNFPSAVNLNDNQVYYIQIYTLSTDLKTVANTWSSSQWNSNTELYVGVTNYASKELTFILSTGTNTNPAVNSAIPDQAATKNVAFSYTFSSTAFTDADTGDRLTYSATLSSGAALPAWLSFNASTRTFSGTPTSAGTISVKVTASDGTGSNNDTFDIVVNTLPVVNSAIPDQTATDSVAFSFQFASNAFTDADSDTLTYSATLSSGAALPAWLSFNAGTRTFSGTPASGDVGTISVKVTANDGKGGTVNDTFDIVVSTGVHHYGISLSSPGATCAGSAITITAYNAGGTAVAPANGVVITLSTSPATGTWVGGSTAAFDGVATSVTKYLQQTTASTLNINVTDGTHSESASIDPDIAFAASSLAFYGSSGLIALPNQVSGTTDSAPIVKVSCSSRVSGTVSVGMAYECRNPTTCVSGQSFKFAAQGVTPNNNGAAISYSTGKTLTFDGSGVAPLSLNYNDVGLVRLHARIVLAASGNDPAITLTAVSSEFVVKPHTLVASAITTSGAVANPGGSSTSGTAAQFVPAGTAFKVYIESRNGAGTKTPNFGNETTSENNLKFVAQSLVYPSGGTLTALTGASTFTSTATPSTGEFLASTVVWDQVGSFTARPELADNDYLGAGDVPNKTVTGTIGRFYPDHFSLASSSTTNSCVAGGFSFLNQAGIGLNYVLQAKSSANTTVTNYGSTYGATQATVSYVAENNNSADGATFSSRLSDGATPTWVSGVMTVASTTASVLRQLTTFAPDGPFTSLQWGLDLTESFDGGRSLSGKNMNALTTGTCSGGTCTAISIGTPLVLRYGRLRLESASGPETASLPVNFLSEYWTGNYFSLNSNDSCTIVPLSAITYPSGTLATAANFNVPLSIGTTTGTYVNSTGGVHFNAGTAGHSFSKPSAAGTGSFVVGINLSTLSWLRYDWNQDGTYSDTSIPNATYTFGTYRGNDRIIYWHERL